jgi:hypothetical protein
LPAASRRRTWKTVVRHVRDAGIPQSLAAADRVDEWRDGQALRVDLEQYH